MLPFTYYNFLKCQEIINLNSLSVYLSCPYLFHWMCKLHTRLVNCFAILRRNYVCLCAVHLATNLSKSMTRKIFKHHIHSRLALTNELPQFALNSCQVIMGSVIGIATNGTILSQILVYQKPDAKKEKKGQ